MFTCLALFANFAYAQQPDGFAPKVGERHRDFVLPKTAAQGQEPNALSATRGKKTLFIQFASW